MTPKLRSDLHRQDVDRDRNAIDLDEIVYDGIKQGDSQFRIEEGRVRISGNGELTDGNKPEIPHFFPDLKRSGVGANQKALGNDDPRSLVSGMNTLQLYSVTEDTVGNLSTD